MEGQKPHYFLLRHFQIFLKCQCTFTLAFLNLFSIQQPEWFSPKANFASLLTYLKPFNGVLWLQHSLYGLPASFIPMLLNYACSCFLFPATFILLFPLHLPGFLPPWVLWLYHFHCLECPFCYSSHMSSYRSVQVSLPRGVSPSFSERLNLPLNSKTPYNFPTNGKHIFICLCIFLPNTSQVSFGRTETISFNFFSLKICLCGRQVVIINEWMFVFHYIWISITVASAELALMEQKNESNSWVGSSSITIKSYSTR